MKNYRYAIVGISNRATGLFFSPLLETYKDRAQIVALLDKDRSRMDWANQQKKTDIPCYEPEQFDQMVRERKPDRVIIACQDGMHHHYVIEALKHHLDVIVEKPLTIDEDKCRALVQAQAKSRGRVTVTFNYRYAPAATKIRELIESHKIGRVISVDLNWYLDTYHGSSYFQRWNRLREVSGGLSIHKACHHFDLVRWWIGQSAQEVFAYGKLNFYGPKGVHNPLKAKQIGDGRTCLSCNSRTQCRYYMRWNRQEYRNSGAAVKIDEHVNPAHRYEGYSPRQCIFDPQINIEDTYAALVRFDQGAYLNYSLNASMPYEGYRLGINGTEGRIDYSEFHGAQRLPFPVPQPSPVEYTPMFGGREKIDVINFGGGHGGGDPLLQDELFIGADLTSPVTRGAGLNDGIEAVMIGIAVHRSANEHKAISIDEMRKRIFK